MGDSSREADCHESSAYWFTKYMMLLLCGTLALFLMHCQEALGGDKNPDAGLYNFEAMRQAIAGAKGGTINTPARHVKPPSQTKPAPPPKKPKPSKEILKSTSSQPSSSMTSSTQSSMSSQTSHDDHTPKIASSTIKPLPKSATLPVISTATAPVTIATTGSLPPSPSDKAPPPKASKAEHPPAGNQNSAKANAPEFIDETVYTTSTFSIPRRPVSATIPVASTNPTTDSFSSDSSLSDTDESITTKSAVSVPTTTLVSSTNSATGSTSPISSPPLHPDVNESSTRKTTPSRKAPARPVFVAITPVQTLSDISEIPPLLKARLIHPPLYAETTIVQKKIQDKGQEKTVNRLDDLTSLRLSQSALLWSVMAMMTSHIHGLTLVKPITIPKLADLLVHLTTAVNGILSTESIDQFTNMYEQIVVNDMFSTPFPPEVEQKLLRNTHTQLKSKYVKENIPPMNAALTLNNTFYDDVIRHLNARPADWSPYTERNVVEISNYLLDNGIYYLIPTGDAWTSDQRIPTDFEVIKAREKRFVFNHCPHELIKDALKALYMQTIEEGFIDNQPVAALAQFRLIYETILDPMASRNLDTLNTMTVFLAIMMGQHPPLLRDKPLDPLNLTHIRFPSQLQQRLTNAQIQMEQVLKAPNKHNGRFEANDYELGDPPVMKKAFITMGFPGDLVKNNLIKDRVNYVYSHTEKFIAEQIPRQP